VVEVGVEETLAEDVDVAVALDVGVFVNVPSGVSVPGVMVGVEVGVGAVAVRQASATCVAVGAKAWSSK
jgi:hypothetical protein